MQPRTSSGTGFALVASGTRSPDADGKAARRLRVAIEQRGPTCHVSLAGTIDEDSSLHAVTPAHGSREIVIDLREVVRINSCGVRDWVNWLAELDREGTRAVLVACSPPIVHQINLVANFVGRGTVASVLLPYRCSACDRDAEVLVATGELAGGREPPLQRCDDCDRLMDFDDLPASYLAFLDHAPRESGPAASRAAARASHEKVRVRLAHAPVRAPRSTRPAPSPPRLGLPIALLIVALFVSIAALAFVVLSLD